MSLYGALNTAVSGLGAQAAAFTNISDNVANSQTVGFKRTDTSFIDYLTSSSSSVNDSGAVATQPNYVNSVQGTISQTDNPLGLAIAGQGFFPVSESTNTSNNTTTFASQQFYTRAGDFSMNNQGYLVNSAGAYLNAWPVDPVTGAVNQTTLAPIQISQTSFSPVATTSLTLSANLPATPATGATTSSEIEVYDSLGTQHTVTLNWTQNAASDWTVSVNVPDNLASAGGPAVGTADVTFGTNGTASGTIGDIPAGSTTGTVTSTGYAANSNATLAIPVDFGSGPQTINLSLGQYGGSDGVTQFAGTTYDLRGVTQNGVAAGSFSSVSTTSTGDIVLNYDNGQSATIAQVPLATFKAPDQLQRQNGEMFTSTQLSGGALVQPANVNGAGNLVTGSVEGSNVDIASEFTKLIVAQQAYSANAKVVTTANQLLTTTIDMKQ